MLTVNITYHANTRLMEIISVSTGEDGDNAIATTGDNLTTRLQFTFDDPDNTLLGYGKRVDFGVVVTDSDGHAFKPFIVINNENYVDIPNDILSNVKCGVLPIQLVFSIEDNGTEASILQSLNQLNLAINKAIDSTAVCPDEFYPQIRDSVVDVEYDDTSSTFTFIRLDGTPIYINLSDLSEEHYEVQHYSDLETLTDAESGDTATVLDTGVWYKLYIQHGIRSWYPMSGNTTINGTQTGTPVFYAPYQSGTSGQYLESRGENNSPEWVSKVTSITAESDTLPTTTAVKTYVDAETTRATTSENALDDKIDAEIQNRIADVDAEETRATTAESNLNTAIGNETTRATNRENAIASDLSDEVSARQTAISNEATARANADATLQGNIDNLASQTQTALNTKRDKIVTPHTSNPVVYTQSYDSESTSYTEGLYDLTDNTTGGTIPVRDQNGKIVATTPSSTDADTTVATKGYVDTGISAEASERSTADTSLQNNIDAETTARSNADTTLQSNIDAEATARSTADTTLDGKITAETTARTNADTTLDGKITAETTARTNADTTLQGNIDDEETRAKGVESGLRSDLTAETTARTNADTTLTNNLATEISDRSSEITRVEGLITAESTARSTADTTLQNNIDGVAGNLADEITNRQTAVTNEATARQSADNTLDGKITTEKNAREQADTAINTAISNEVTRATGVESGLNTRVTAIENVIPSGTDANNKLTNKSYVDDADTALQTSVTGLQNNKLDKTFNSSVFVGASSTNTVVTASGVSLTFNTKNTNNNNTGTVVLPLPVATSTDAGVATASQIAQIEQNRQDIALLSGKSSRYAINVDLSNKTSAQIQTALTSAWRTASGQSTGDPDEYTTLVNLWNNHEYTWLDVSGTESWVDRGISTVSIATDSSLGVVMGTPQTAGNEGNVYVDSSGSMAVIGWDDAISDISNAKSDITSLQNGKLDSVNQTGTGYVSSVSVNSGDHTQLDVVRTALPTIGNATITIKKNGTAVDTFTTNATANKAIDIQVVDNVQSDWNSSSGLSQILNKPTLATVATSGSYNDLSNKPTIPTIPDIVVNQTTASGYVSSVAVDSSNKHKLNVTRTSIPNVAVTNGTAETGKYISAIAQNGHGISVTKASLPTIPNISVTDTDTGNVVTDVTASGHTITLTRGKSLGADIPTPTSTDESKALIVVKNGTSYEYDFGEAGKVDDVKVNTVSVVTNKIANITVPTKVSDLTNDAGYTTNTGTVTQVKVGNTAYDPSSGIVSLPAYPTVNNATLTIQKNGTTVKTFTANASSNVTANITVPTKTSDLTNDSGFITGLGFDDLSSHPTTTSGYGITDAVTNVSYDSTSKKIQKTINGTTSDVVTLATVATSGSYNDLSNKPTIPTVNNATLSIQGNGTTASSFTANASSNVTLNIKGSGGTTVTKSANNEITISTGTIPTVNNGTLTIKQNGTSKATFTANQSGNSTAELTDTTYSAGPGLTLSNTTFSETYPIYYAKPNETTATATLTATISNFPTAYADGIMIALRMPFNNSENSTLNVNGIGAKPVYYANNTVTATRWGPSGCVALLVYETTTASTGCWKAVYSYDSNSDTKARQTLQTGNYNLPLLMSYVQTSETATNKDGVTYRNNGIYANPSTGKITSIKYTATSTDADAITGNLTGNVVGDVTGNCSGSAGSVAWANVTGKPSFATVATSGSYNDLSNKPTIPTVYNKTLKIQGASTDVVSFTANSNTDVTLNIVGANGTTVTADATNKKITISSANLATVATSGSYNDLSNKPTIPTVNNGTLNIQGDANTVGSFTANATGTTNINFASGTKISIGRDTTNKKLTINHTNTTRTDTTSTASPAHGGTFTAVDGVTTDATGHITAINVKTVTLPADQNTDTKVTETVSTTDNWYPILASPTANATATATTTSIFASGIKLNPAKTGIIGTQFGGYSKSYELQATGYKTVLQMKDASTFWTTNSAIAYVTAKIEYSLVSFGSTATLDAKKAIWIVNAKYTGNDHSVDIESIGDSVGTGNGILRYLASFAPKNSSYYPQIAVALDNANTKVYIRVTILSASEGWQCPSTIGGDPGTTNYNRWYGEIGRYNYTWSSNKIAGNITGSCDGTAGSTWDSLRNDRYVFGESAVAGSIMAMATDGRMYKLRNGANKVFKLPLHLGRCTGTFTYDGSVTPPTLTNYAQIMWNMRSQGYSELTNASMQGSAFTVPTLTAGQYGLPLYITGTLSNGGFVPDGNIVTAMVNGKTNVQIGRIDRANTALNAVPTLFTITGYSQTAYTLNASGKLTHIDGKEVTEIGNMKYTDQSVSFTANSDAYSTDYPYRATLTSPSTTASSYASVVYSAEQVSSGNFAPFCRTDNGVVYLYSKVSGTYTIPTISVGIDLTDYTRQPVSADIVARTLTLISSTNTDVDGYPYKYSFPCAGASAQSTADVTFGSTDARSGNFAPICDTGANVIYVYAKSAQTSCYAGYQLYYSDSTVTLTPAGNVGSDTKPVKIVGGQVEAVANDLLSTQGDQTLNGTLTIANGYNIKFGTSGNGISELVSPLYLASFSGSTSDGLRWSKTSSVTVNNSNYVDLEHGTRTRVKWNNNTYQGIHASDNCTSAEAASDVVKRRMKIMAGSIFRNGSESRTYITFPEQFTTTPVVVVCPLTSSGSAPSNAWNVLDYSTGAVIGTAGFTINCDAGSETIEDWMYIAVGGGDQ